MDIDERVRAAIAASGQTQADIARAAGLPSATVNRIANGKRRACTRSLNALCGVLPGLADAVAEELRRAS
jgi:transcriptional regulator with XRE-family HTH domain